MLKRLLVSVLVIVAMLGIQGCNKTWSVRFTSLDDLSGWVLQGLLPPAEWDVSYDGLYLNGVAAHSPFGFEGDFKMTLEFELHVGENNDLDSLMILFTNGGLAPFSDHIMSAFGYVGGPNEFYYSEDVGTSNSLLNIGLFTPGLDRDGTNIYRFEKHGIFIKAYINGAELFDNTISQYQYTTFYPSIYIGADSSDQIAIKGIRVVYDDNTTVFPRT